MGWNRDWSSASGVPWIAVTDVNDFIKAVNERQGAVNGQRDLYDEKAVGDMATGHCRASGGYNWIQDLQGFVNTHYNFFVVSHDAGVQRNPNHWEGGATPPKDDRYGSLAEVFAAAGLAYSDWRRYTVHPSEGGDVQYGVAQEGDVLAPWLLTDLQAVLNVLVWRGTTIRGTRGQGDWEWAEWSNEGETNAYQGDGDPQETWPLAKADAEAKWGPWYQADEEPPRCKSVGSPWYDDYVAYLERYYAYLVTGEYLGDRACGVDFFVYAVKPSDDTVSWDANGDDVLEEAYSLWHSQTAAAGASGWREIVSTAPLGGTARPNWPGVSQPPPGGISHGYRVMGDVEGHPPGGAALLRYDVPGGFEYC